VKIDYKLFLLQDLISHDSFINQSASLSGPIDLIYPARLKKDHRFEDCNRVAVEFF
jgi:hypothetical protein